LQVISPVAMGSQRIEEVLSGESLPAICQAGDGAVEIYLLNVPPAWHGSILRDVVPQEQYCVASVTRAGRSSLPKFDAPVESGDLLHVSATREAAQALRERLEKLRKD
jgi:Trk K+ transport system NAD-binding subunit